MGFIFTLYIKYLQVFLLTKRPYKELLHVIFSGKNITFNAIFNKSNKKNNYFFKEELVVTPLGFEPKSKEPESFILSIELRSQFKTQNYDIF